MREPGERKASGDPATASDLAPCSEVQFTTLKYRPRLPDRFGSLEDARRFGQVFFPWHNDEHHHGGVGVPPGEGRRLG
jgi:hypothetical protein